MVVVDAVASVGAETLQIDEWELDLVVLSTQKALAGPTGASAAVVSDAAWEWLECNPSAPRDSILSLLDWKHRWLDRGSHRSRPSPTTRDEAPRGGGRPCLAEGLVEVVARHGGHGTNAGAASTQSVSSRSSQLLTTLRRRHDGQAPAGSRSTLLAAARADAGAALELLLSAAPRRRMAHPDQPHRSERDARGRPRRAHGLSRPAEARCWSDLEDHVGEVVEGE